MVSGSTVKSSQSSQESGSSGCRNEGKSLNGLSSMAGSSSDNLGRVVESRIAVLALTMVGLVADEQGVISAEALLGGGFSLACLEADGSFLGETLSRGVVKAGEVHGVGREAFSSGMCSLGLSTEAAVMFGQCPQDVAWLSHDLSTK